MTSLPAAKRLRLWELLLVVWIAFSGSLLTSFYAGFLHPGTPLSSEAGSLRTGIAIINQIGPLALLGYVLFRQGRGLRDIGLVLSWKALPLSVALFVTASAASWLWAWGMAFAFQSVTGTRFHMHHANIGFLHGADRGWSLPLLLIYGLINPFKEELIARAYVMSEARFLTGRWWGAIVVSVALQVSYHFYQGVFAALSYIALFLVFSLYYARTRLILPVILAHLYFDLLSLAFPGR